ncbi:MAG: hypothetical protein CVU39_11725 [Chloroflexi bacterium HGW-Chloroflexi-10]|nr:MAG: hypothetical protein CVU39_11725 [Chloroflexi bacterium HGW-Chloroflexi-10]
MRPKLPLALFSIFIVWGFVFNLVKTQTVTAYPLLQTDTNEIFLPVVLKAVPTPVPTPTSAPTPVAAGIVINHTAITQFDRIPDSYITAASQLHSLFRHASVGDNIDIGLDCLMNTTLPRPNVCTTGLLPGQDLYDSKYDRSNWDFEFHAPPPSQNPGWWDKVNFFVSRVDGLGSGSSYQVVAFKFGYVDAYTGSAIDNVFFTRNANDSYPGIEDLEVLQTRHPNKLVVLWTMGLARAIGTVDSTSFNNQMRTYAITNEIPLMDIADIQSHRPNGTLCVDNQGNNQPALCDEYTEEINGGHLNTLGKQIMAKAYWVMMARLAGWQP